MARRGKDLKGRQLSVAPHWLEENPRRPNTWGYVAFEVLRRAPRGILPFEEYERRLFNPDAPIRELAASLRGTSTYQDLKHIRCDIKRGCVLVDPPLPPVWYEVERCSGGHSLHRRRVSALVQEAPGEIPIPDLYWEGASRRVFVNAYERNPAARKACIAHHGMACKACDLQFEEVYGDIGEGFIHVHHIVPLNRTGAGYQVDPITDLVPVCPNCHAMLHRRDPPLSVEALRRVIEAL